MDESASSEAVPMEEWPQQTVPPQETAQPAKLDAPQGEIIEISESSSSDEEEKEPQLTIVDLDDDDDDDDEEARNEANKEPQEKEEEKIQVVEDDTQEHTSQDTHSDCVETDNMETRTKENDTEAAVTVLDLSTDNEEEQEAEEEEDEQAVERQETEKQEEDEQAVEGQETEKQAGEDEQAIEGQEVEKQEEEEEAKEEQEVERESQGQEVEKEEEEQEVEEAEEEQEVEKEEEEQEVGKEEEEQEVEKEEEEQEVEKEDEEQDVEKEEEEMEEGEKEEEQKEEFEDHMVKHLKVVESLQPLPKLNGNHSISINDLDENSCSSAASSTSSLNLVIDHPLAEEIPPQKPPITEDHEKTKPIVETKSLKRKHSECEGDSPQHKQLHLDPADSSPRLEIANTNSGLDSEMECTIISPLRQPEIRSPARTEHVEEVHKSDAVYEKSPDVPQKIVVKSPPQPLNASETSIEPPTPPPPVMKPPSPNPFSQYIGAPAKSLTVPKLNFDCFKCKSAVFETFTQLRDHLKACLFKENHKKTLPALQGTIPTPQQAVQTAVVLAKDKTSVAAQSEMKKIVAESPVKKRFYLCSSCGTYHENWNLFLHIREIHNRHVCLYCIRLFPTAEKLSLHLEIKHDLEQNHFNSEDKLRSVSKGDGNSRFLMCCTCQHVFSEHERFSDHVCTEYMQPCSLCHQKGRHLNNCKANPEKRPKAKKKPKAPPAVGKAKSNIPIPKPSTVTPVATTIATTVIHQQNSFNNNQLKLPPSLQIIPSVPALTHLSPEPPKQNGFTLPHPIENRQQKHTEEYNYQSDDSTNMVIDETCSSNNYITQMAGVNPFKALDERERLQEEMQKTVANKPTLPPDRVPEAIPEPKPLIVPKIKLRVPKEFQKAVESEIYSTESDDDDDVDEDQEKSEQQNIENNFSNSVNDTNAKGDDSDENDACSMDEKDNTQDGDDEYNSNSNLDRILKEIEKTKLDIQRTKEMLEPMNNLRKAPPPPPIEEPANLPASPEQPEQPEPTESTEQTVRPSSPTDLLGNLNESVSPSRSRSPSPITNPSPSSSLSPIPVSPIENRPTVSSWQTPEYGMYSPTPPPTPNSVWASPLYPQSVVSPAVLREVSERENIENMEKESEHAKEYVSESEKMDISTDLDVDSVENRESSTMDMDEKPNNSPIHSPPPTLDFTPIAEQTEDKRLSERMAEDSGSKPDDAEDENVEVVAEKIPPADGIDVASDDIQITDLLLDRPLEKFEIVEFVRFCVNAVYSLCLYCNHARRIAVNGHSLVLHLLAQHRFAATVDSITAEELLPSTIVSKLKSFLSDLEEHYLNLGSYCSFPPKESNVIPCDERVFECFQCRFSTKMHKDLYLHNRKMHLKTAILCFMCRSNFFSFSEILCHICPGTPNKVTVFDIKFRCCLCEVDGIPSPFRLMVHLRKKHFACDICLEDCREQGRLSSHVWKHKLHHLCYRCGIAYRNKMDITKHLFWKHGTESINCKRCLQKRWRHVYHFCVPPTSFFCESCNLCFSKATYLRVHKRVHSGDFRYPCTEDNCEEKFISRKLLLKHSATHAPPPEIKIEEKVENETSDVKGQPEDHVKAEEIPKEEDSLQEKKPDVEEKPKVEEKKEDKEVGQVSKRKKKRNRNKESLEDLNLTAPNLSESDSSGESDNEKLKTEDQDSLVPNVMLSPPSEEEKDDEKEPKVEKDADKIMDIWENFKSFQASQQTKQDEDDEESLTESNYPTPILHVACSDHDYCAMYKIRPRPQIEERKSEMSVEPEPLDLMSDTENDKPEPEVREKSHSPSKKKRKTTASGSSSSDSSSGSDSSCSCGSNCSCSTSGSSSNSSSSSDEDSDSSTSEGRRRIAKKKQQRAEQRNRWKSESSQKASLSENTEVVVEDKEPIRVPSPAKENLEPILLETDLETAESETDEEFYDEHPQKLASELLAEKRLQLRAQMRLSPSHNFDIMENSRPSTPSLPEEMVKERKIKLKKKKRDRKSTCKSQAVPPIKLNLAVNKVEMASQPPTIHQTSMQVPEVDLEPPHNLIASPGVAEPPVAQQPPTTPHLQNNLVKPVPFFHTRMSEGSSCSDADNSLKRSKRARRPNKFYGYTSDDENTQGTPLMIGSRTFKPQPPPQLTWRKEDLPAPSKSILLNKQPRSPRTPKTPGVSSGHAKKRVHQKSNQIKKKKQRALPPIPLLKIRPSAIGIVPPVAQTPFSHPAPANHTYSSSRDNSDDSGSSDDDLELPAPKTLASATVPSWAPNATAQPSTPVTPVTPYVKPVTPPPPSPQASAFNQKIPPALLPNPDFATIQYFKRNNIRYPIRPPAGARQARDGESVYCYCRCPYDEVSEMIACDGDNCLIEWFHFECVGIMVAPQGKWFCAECRPKYSNELYPQL